MYSDEQIISLLKEDREKGAEVLVEKYEVFIKNTCKKNLNNKEDIHECVNDVITEICMNSEKYDEKKGSLKNYIRIIAERKSIDQYRKNIRRQKMEEEIFEHYKENQMDKIQEERDSKVLKEALDKLSPLDKKILSMHYIDDLSYKEISEKIGMNYENVRKRGARGKKKLLYLILIGILLFGISASAVMNPEKREVLWELFPFFKNISSKEKTDREENIIINKKKEKQGPYQKVIEIENTEEIEVTKQIKKYQYSSGKGLLRTEKPVYEMEKNNQKCQIESVIYEIKDIFYFDGKWEIQFLLTCLDPDYVKIDGINENSSIENLIYADNNREKKWGHYEIDYLEKAYLIMPDGKKISLIGDGFETPSDSEPEIIVLKMSCEGHLKDEIEEEKIGILLPDGQRYDIIVKKLDVKEYVENTLENQKQDKSETGKNEENNEESEVGTTEESKGESETGTTEEKLENPETGIKEETEIHIGTDITIVKDGMAVVNLYQADIEEYTIADLITESHFGVPREEKGKVTLQDKEGNLYQSMRIIKTIDESGNRINYEIYFRGINPGNYKLNIPCLCLQKDMSSEMIQLNLPLEEGRIDYDETVLFPDGSGFHITGITLIENNEEVYYWDGVQVEIEEKKVYYYEIEYEPLSKGNIKYNSAKASGITSEGVAVNAMCPVIDGKTKYTIRAIDEKKMESVELKFYEPTYYLDQPYSFEVEIQE